MMYFGPQTRSIAIEMGSLRRGAWDHLTPTDQPEFAGDAEYLTRRDTRRSPADVVVFACGRSHRQDDQIGLMVADALSHTLPVDTRIIKSESPGPDVLEDWKDAGLLIVVDAAHPNEQLKPGDWRRIDLRRDDRTVRGVASHHLLATSAMSSHFLGIVDALMLGAELDLLPQDVWVYAVAAEDFGYGTDLSPAAARAAECVARSIRADIGTWLRRESSYA